MKRKKTRFEELITECGWKLAFKTYCGKHQEKVDYYVYEKKYENGRLARVKLDAKRTRWYDITIKHNLDEFADFYELYQPATFIEGIIEKELCACYYESLDEEQPKENPEETVAVVECVEEND